MKHSSLFSAQWHRVRDVSPSMASDVEVTRHIYRGRVSYLLHRRSTTVSHRLDAISYELIDKLDGQTTVGQLWEQAVTQRDQDAPTQDELIALFHELYSAELIVLNKRIAAERMYERRQKLRSNQLRQKFMNPLYMRFALHDPDSWLDRWVGVAQIVFSRYAAILWCLLVGYAGLGMITHSDSLIAAIVSADVFSSRNALMFVLIYPMIKLVHELAHALAVKRRGGRVHETGLALMVLLPLPYVDASSSTLFPNKYDRMLVSSAGILVELAFAALGFILWMYSDGLVQEMGLLMFLIGGVSTLLLNGNPLLKFDGYYFLADWLEIPNLAGRGRKALNSTFRRIVSGDVTPGERGETFSEKMWLWSYGLSSSIYRTLLLLSIAWMLSDRWYFIGVLLAVFAIFAALVQPIWRGLLALVRDPVYRTFRAASVTLMIPLLILSMIFMLPLPHSSVTQGVVWLPDEALVRASSACEIKESYIRPGVDVQIGEELFLCNDPAAKTHYQELQAKVDELLVKRAGMITRDPLARGAIDVEIEASEAALEDASRRLQEARKIAKLAGRFDVVGTSALPGRSVNRGDIVAYVVPSAGRTIRVALDEKLVQHADNALDHIEVRVLGVQGSATVHKTTVVRRTPKASKRVATAALSSAGGGSHLADPSGDGSLLLTPVFDYELEWPESADAMPVGAHVGVRFVYSSSPVIDRISTQFSQMMGKGVNL